MDGMLIALAALSLIAVAAILEDIYGNGDEE